MWYHGVWYSLIRKFIDHSFEEPRQILKRKQHDGNIIDIKLIWYTSVNSNMEGTRHFVTISVCSFEKIENFDNAVEFLLLKSLFYTLYSFRISNWEIISHKIKKLHHLLKTSRIFAWSRYLQKLESVGAIRASSPLIVLQIKTLVDIKRPSCYANRSL